MALRVLAVVSFVEAAAGNNLTSDIAKEKARKLESCEKVGQQCRNENWEKCCEEGSTCVYMSNQYSECKPDSEANACVPAENQCKGDWFDGQKQDWEKCCEDGTTCVYVNKQYSECKPDGWQEFDEVTDSGEAEGGRPNVAQEKAPASEKGEKAAQQCRSETWEKDCEPGFTCVYMSNQYSECKPDSEATACLPAWNQCKGDWFDGQKKDWEKCCEDGTTCVYVNKQYSECKPDGWQESDEVADSGESEGGRPKVAQEKAPGSENGEKTAQQCRSETWEKDCEPGFTCVYMSNQYSECKPDSEANACVPAENQCKGDWFDGQKQDWEKCCEDGTTCVYVNKQYSECKPDGSLDVQMKVAEVPGSGEAVGGRPNNFKQAKRWEVALLLVTVPGLLATIWGARRSGRAVAALGAYQRTQQEATHSTAETA